MVSSNTAAPETLGAAGYREYLEESSNASTARAQTEHLLTPWGGRRLADCPLEPYRDRVVTRVLDDQRKRDSGLLLPENARMEGTKAIVLAVGPGRRLPDGTRDTIDLSLGDIVIFPYYAGTEILVERDRFKVIRADEVLATIVTAIAPTIIEDVQMKPLETTVRAIEVP